MSDLILIGTAVRGLMSICSQLSIKNRARSQKNTESGPQCFEGLRWTGELILSAEDINCTSRSGLSPTPSLVFTVLLTKFYIEAHTFKYWPFQQRNNQWTFAEIFVHFFFGFPETNCSLTHTSIVFYIKYITHHGMLRFKKQTTQTLSKPKLSIYSRARYHRSCS